MKRIAMLTLLIFICLPHLFAHSTDDKEVLAELLDTFLYGASVQDAAIHDRFWSEDLIYTSSDGLRYGKNEIMQNMEGTSPVEDPATIYTAEDVQIRVYEKTAVVAFKLVATSTEAGSPETSYFFNTGTFVKEYGTWRAVAWQATRARP